MQINKCMDKKDYPRTRGEAREKGMKFYYTGKPCKRNHDCLRRVTGHCVECGREHNRIYSKPNGYHKSEAWKKYQKEYQKKYRYAPENQERLRAIQLKYYIKKNYNGDVEAYEQAQREREAKRQGKT